MPKVKNVEAFCSICGAVKKFEITGEYSSSEEDSRRWAKCKSCKQTQIIDLNNIVVANKPDFVDIEQRDSKNYSPDHTYNVGDVIYHKKWDDYGIVINKFYTSDGKSSITVEFKKSGIKKLIESHKTQTGSEVI
ncbi:MAG: hypothetical protein N2043_09985 [Ignavibacterium sp.]|nr:hypothetical protein [Ignavibacterium sp.]